MSVSKKLFKAYLPENPIIVEAGAHKGVDTLQFARIWPEAEIHSFEPVQKLYDELALKLNDQQCVHLYNMALSSKTGFIDFYESVIGCDAVSSILEPINQDTKFEKKSVRSISLDDWATQNQISKIDLMWLDMQGYELYMLKASSNIFKTVKAIHIEVNITKRYKNLPNYNEILHWLNLQGFNVVATAQSHPDWHDYFMVKQFIA